MLVECRECSHQVSDKAFVCPCCGYPMKNEKSKPRRKAKYRRLPNGFGQITEIKNRNLRNPFRVLVTTGHNENGKPICKPLKPQTYFISYNDAYAALVEYHRHPFNLTEVLTCDELYKRWSVDHYKNNERQLSIANSLWRYCYSVYNVNIREIRVWHIKECMFNSAVTIKGKLHHTNANTAMRIKLLFGMMLDYAVEYDLVEKNYARAFSLDEETRRDAQTVKKGHKVFTDEEIQKLWDNVNKLDGVNMILIQCYSGWRPQELCGLELENIDLMNDLMIGGMKTDAGKNRIVPIHSKIKELVKQQYDHAILNGSKYLFYKQKKNEVKQFTYAQYNYLFKTTMEKLELDTTHSPHDCRKQFVTMAKDANMDEYAIKYVVGHTIKDLTERTYTERKPEWLKQEIKKIR